MGAAAAGPPGCACVAGACCGAGRGAAWGAGRGACCCGAGRGACCWPPCGIVCGVANWAAAGKAPARPTMAATTAAAILACGMLRAIVKSMDLYTVGPSKALGVRGFGYGFDFKCGLVLYGSAMHWKLRQSKRG